LDRQQEDHDGEAKKEQKNQEGQEGQKKRYEVEEKIREEIGEKEGQKVCEEIGEEGRAEKNRQEGHRQEEPCKKAGGSQTRRQAGSGSRAQASAQARAGPIGPELGHTQFRRRKSRTVMGFFKRPELLLRRRRQQIGLRLDRSG
jgi:hypothetical protein